MHTRPTDELQDEHTNQALAAQLQHRHAGRVLANQLHTERRWGRPCRAFSLYVNLPAPVTGALGVAQDAIAAGEPGLLRVPRHALHSMAATLVPVWLDAPAAEKEHHWQQHGPRWRETIAAELAALGSFRLRYTDIVATGCAGRSPGSRDCGPR
jgi:hypothetical protein